MDKSIYMNWLQRLKTGVKVLSVKGVDPSDKKKMKVIKKQLELLKTVIGEMISEIEYLEFQYVREKESEERIKRLKGFD